MVISPILPLLLQNVTVKRRGQVILGPVNFTLSGRGITVVIGPNGAGKSTLLRTMHGIERTTDGRVSWARPDARAHQAFVFQTPILLRRTVLDNLIYPLRLIKTPHAQAQTQAMEWGERIGLGDHLDHPALSLSGGEAQKLALARALIRTPQVLFLDEPCANLDGAATQAIETILQEAAQNGTRIVISTHNMGQARRLGRDVVFLHQGQIIEQGADTFWDNPQTPQARAFLNGEILT